VAVETVRITRTWDVEVEAVYKDTPDALFAKVGELGAPDHEHFVILPDYNAIAEHGSDTAQEA
jgi:hypothetical protein